MTFTDDAFDRINCFGIGAWLATAFEELGQTWPPSSLKPDTDYVTQRSRGLVFAISRIATSLPNWHDELVLARIEGDATAQMPLTLDPRMETLASTEEKLSPTAIDGSPADVAVGDCRVSFFLNDARVVELRFLPNLVGFDRILMARLGAALDWREIKER